MNKKSTDSRFDNSDLYGNNSIHMSRILKNGDISNELAMSQDITFDQEILD